MIVYKLYHKDTYYCGSYKYKISVLRYLRDKFGSKLVRQTDGNFYLHKYGQVYKYTIKEETLKLFKE